MLLEERFRLEPKVPLYAREKRRLRGLGSNFMLTVVEDESFATFDKKTLSSARETFDSFRRPCAPFPKPGAVLLLP